MIDFNADMFREAIHRGELISELCLAVIAGGRTPEETAELLGIKFFPIVFGNLRNSSEVSTNYFALGYETISLGKATGDLL